jgi:hypothetical protein
MVHSGATAGAPISADRFVGPLVRSDGYDLRAPPCGSARAWAMKSHENLPDRFLSTVEHKVVLLQGNRSKGNSPVILAVRGHLQPECGGDPAQDVPKAR